MCRPLITTVLLATVVGVSGCGSNTNTPGPIVSPGPLSQSGPQPSVISINSVSPAAAVAGSADVTVTFTGSNFQPWNFALWNGGTILATKYVSDTQLTAVLPARLLQTPGSAQLLVVDGDVEGYLDGHQYLKSNAVSFSVIAP